MLFVLFLRVLLGRIQNPEQNIMNVPLTRYVPKLLQQEQRSKYHYMDTVCNRYNPIKHG
jgi:hypothetical protein